MARNEDPILTMSTGMSISIILGTLALGLASQFHMTLFSPGTSPVQLGEIPVAPTQSEPSVPLSGWTTDEVMQEREVCMHSLQSISTDVVLLDPIESDKCGAPAPVLVKSLGSDPKLVFDPPVTMNCRMMTALAGWNRHVLQPAALRTLKSSVTRVVGASGYSCRNVYGLPTGNLSQHAFANAIDLGAFGLADGRMVTVLSGWGPTKRDLQASMKLQTTISAKPADMLGKQRPENVRLKNRNPGLKPPNDVQMAAAAGAQHLNAGSLSIPPTPEMRFLRGLQSGACGPFTTVLGPEANDAHRTHLHLDLNAARIEAHCH